FRLPLESLPWADPETLAREADHPRDPFAPAPPLPSAQRIREAVALGARGTLIGRAFLYGLGALGEAGVTKCLEIIARELDLTMAFCGRRDIREVDRSILVPGTYPQ
ncbi:MAG: alpha-hydroxy-acid oxidizing protein, partial [Burkholderiaceae bacterium]|nr:alpha-hydroxy-acid oxidizing protein [Burkholderiaceae bacterium]